MGHSSYDPVEHGPAWNAGKKLGAKRPLKPKEIWETPDLGSAICMILSRFFHFSGSLFSKAAVSKEKAHFFAIHCDASNPGASRGPC